MRSYFNLILFSFIFIFIGCKKKDIKPTPKEPVELASDYLPLKTGNYWIYEQFETDTNHVTKSLHIFDSVYVKGETIINGKTYWVVCDQDKHFPRVDSLFYYRFENNTLIDQAGIVLLSTTDFSSVLNYMEFTTTKDTFYTATSKMDDRNMKTTVKAGTFTTITYRTTYKSFQPFCDLIEYFPIQDKRYALNTGVVYEILPGYCDVLKLHYRELVRYHIN